MITMNLVEQYGFNVYWDGTHIGNICPSGDEHEWAAYTVNANGTIRTQRISTSKDILDSIDDLEAIYLKKENK